MINKMCIPTKIKPIKYNKLNTKALTEIIKTPSFRTRRLRLTSIKVQVFAELLSVANLGSVTRTR